MDIAAKRAEWDANGFVVLKRYLAAQALDRLDLLIRSVWSDHAAETVVDDLATGRRALARDLSADDKKHRFKINDLYLIFDEVRGLALGAELSELLAGLLGEPVVLCNSLNLEYGSGQPEHVDSLYMTPQTPGKLLAIWVALEEAHADAGPLFYYPGSHLIPRYRFSSGGYHAIESEMPAWHGYIRTQLIERGLERRTFLAERGDIFIWSSDILHGGLPVLNEQQTRKSIVFHYYALGDCERMGLNMKSMHSGYWWDRKRQPVPEDSGPEPVVSWVKHPLRKLGRLLFSARRAAS
jgi:phytanoyl-CoA hydroxylase